ncbi:unnamed protein product [Lymnaea stagnalis]|uniref:Low molecular weight phosphotyrosine protein phosphatase n=1 Tax=Lymnaea stagnalis TaxID=6523 RepID=A0AAV2I524_LYMST
MMIMASNKKKHSVLFVCFGNTCRSTMAEGIFQHLVKQRGISDKWIIDSAGIGSWFINCPPNERTMRVLEKNGISDYKHLGRQITEEDFRKFEFIFGMDHGNVEDLKQLAPPNSTAMISLLGEWDPQKELVIRDPYFEPSSNNHVFDKVYAQCLRCCKKILECVS